MKILTYAQALAEFAGVLDAVTDDCEEVVITRTGHENVVIVPLAEYASLRETAHLLRSPANARRPLTSIDHLEHGGGAPRTLVYDE